METDTPVGLPVERLKALWKRDRGSLYGSPHEMHDGPSFAT